MFFTRKRVVILILACISLLAVWSVLQSSQPPFEPDTVTPETARTSESLADNQGPAQGPETFKESKELPQIARKRVQSLDAEPDEHLANAYELLASRTSYGIREAALVVAKYGDPDKATEAIIDLIENREDLTAENSKALEGQPEQLISQVQHSAYLARLRVITPLGFTGTERAEQFLLRAYRNPHQIKANERFRTFSREQRLSGRSWAISAIEIDQLTLGCALTGLVLLDDEKYSPMIEEEFNRLLPDVEQIYSGDDSHMSVDGYVLSTRFFKHVEALVMRDAVQEYGTEQALDIDFLNHYERFSGRYWDSQANTGGN